MTIVQHLHLGPDAHPIERGQHPHGRWRIGYYPATAAPPDPDAVPVTPSPLEMTESAPQPEQPWRAALHIIHDAERLTFSLCEGAAADLLAERMAEYLWIRESADEDWPVTLREWLADLEQWSAADPGRTAFIGGRLDRDIAGGRIYLAWLGMNGVILLDRQGNTEELDTVLAEGEQWTPRHGPEPVGMALHAYRGGLFGLDRLLVFTSGAAPIGPELPDLAATALQQALEDWSEGAASDLSFFDLRLNPILTEPRNIVVNYRWISRDTCLIFWQPSPNATGYRIEESTTLGFEEPALIAELTDGRQIRYQISPPASGPCFYRVTPINQGIPGTPSQPFSPTPITLTAPIMEPVEWTSTGGFLLRWTPIPQATSYEVQVSMSADFDPHDSMIIFRGEMPELHLPGDSPPNQYYRVRASNALYAPQMPSAWSDSQRAPARLPKPVFSHVSPERLEWEPVPGARQYVIEVSAPDLEPELLTTAQPLCIPAEQAASYRVQARRHPEDQRTASEWSEQINFGHDKGLRPSPLDARFAVPVLVAGVVVALLVGLALGLIGLSAYQDANATATRTSIAQAEVVATRQAATSASVLATQAEVQSTRAAENFAEGRSLLATNAAIDQQRSQVEATGTRVAALMQVTAWADLTRTHIPSDTPTITLTPSMTPNLTETLDSAFAAGLTATAAGWTATPTATETLTPSMTPNLTETLESAFVAGLTATAAGWTATPTPTETPTPTRTLVPSRTPNVEATIDAAVEAALAGQLTATAEVYAAQTATYTADFAALPEGCFLVMLPEDALPVLDVPETDAAPVSGAAALWQPVTGRLLTEDGLWLQLSKLQEDTVLGWTRLPEDVALAALVGGPNCDLTAAVPDFFTPEPSPTATLQPSATLRPTATPRATATNE